MANDDSLKELKNTKEIGKKVTTTQTFADMLSHRGRQRKLLTCIVRAYTVLQWYLLPVVIFKFLNTGYFINSLFD